MLRSSVRRSSGFVQVGLAETMLISETPLVSLIPDLGLFGVKCTGLALFVGVDNSEAIELSEKYGETYSSRVLSRSVVTLSVPILLLPRAAMCHTCAIFS